MKGRWAVVESIALELEMACLLLSTAKPGELPEETAQIPREWWEEGAELAGAGNRWAWPLGAAAWLAGVLTETDYRTATMAIRELSVEGALARLAGALPSGAAQPAVQGSPAEQLVDLAARWMKGAFERHGLIQVQAERWEEGLRRELVALTRVLKGGDLHARFWFWLDQGYFQFYQPWRAQRREQTQQLAREARERLDSRGLDGLPPQSALNYYPGLRSAVEAGDLELYCWIDPFGIFDHWFLYPGLLTVAVGKTDQGVTGVRSTADQVAGKLKALADPTRLIILQLVRNFAMDNTEMAAYLGVTRQTVSVHAQILRDAGLIETRQRGRQASHSLNAGEVERLCSDLLEFLDLKPANR